MIESTSMASLLTERCYRSTPRGVLTAHAWWLCQCETGACQYHWCSIYRGLERVGSWVPGGSVGRDQLAMAAKVRRHWFNPCRLGSRGHLGANFSLLLYTDLIKKRKPSRYFTDEGELIRDYIVIVSTIRLVLYGPLHPTLCALLLLQHSCFNYFIKDNASSLVLGRCFCILGRTSTLA